jgi:hypothetical protein
MQAPAERIAAEIGSPRHRRSLPDWPRRRGVHRPRHPSRTRLAHPLARAHHRPPPHRRPGHRPLHDALGQSLRPRPRAISVARISGRARHRPIPSFPAPPPPRQSYGAPRSTPGMTPRSSRQGSSSVSALPPRKPSGNCGRLRNSKHARKRRIAPRPDARNDLLLPLRAAVASTTLRSKPRSIGVAAAPRGGRGSQRDNEHRRHGPGLRRRAVARITSAPPPRSLA